MEDAFTLLTDNTVKPNLFYKDDKQFLEDLLSISGTKHYYHLRFLSAKHLHKILKIRFVPQPFGFVFLVEGATHYYLVWETLDTEEATYLWPIDKSRDAIKKRLSELDKTVNFMRTQGRQAYLNTTTDEYDRIIHTYRGDDNGFAKWKEELEAKTSLLELINNR